jgi:hypothetical protein
VLSARLTREQRRGAMKLVRQNDFGRRAGTVTLARVTIMTHSAKAGASCPSPFSVLSVPHSIRLRGPWQYQPLARFETQADGTQRETTDDLPPGGDLVLPADWGAVLGREFCGTVRFSRVFHRPTGLAAASKVWLIVEDVHWRARVALNDRLLGEVICSRATASEPASELHRCPSRFDVTSLLEPHNRLSIDVTSPAKFPNGPANQTGGLIGLVRIQIEIVADMVECPPDS